MRPSVSFAGGSRENGAVVLATTKLRNFGVYATFAVGGALLATPAGLAQVLALPGNAREEVDWSVSVIVYTGR